MERWLPEVIAAGDLKCVGYDLGVGVELLVDGGLDAELGAEPCQEFANGPGTLPMEADHLTAEPEVGHHLGREGAD